MRALSIGRMLLVASWIIVGWAGPGLCRWQVFTASDGLAASSVTQMAEDHSGNMWFVNTYNWASCYDGVTWRTYRVGVDRCANSVIVDRLGRVWLATCEGAKCYDGTAWHAYTLGEAGLRSVNTVFEDRSGNLWFGTDGGVVRFDGTNWRTYTQADGLGSRRVSLIYQARTGALWFADSFYGSGVSCFDGESWTAYTRADGLPYEEVDTIFDDSSGAMWFGYWGDRMVTRYDGVTWRTFTEADGFVGGNVSSFVEDQLGNVWIGTSRGISRYDGSVWRNYTTADGLADANISSAFKDRFGNLWFGTGDGVCCFDGARWRVYRAIEGPGLMSVNEIMEDTSGNLWFGSFSGGVSMYDGSSWRTVLPGEGVPDAALRAIAKDRAGNIWVGTYGGAARYDGFTWRTYTTADGLANDIVLALLEDRSGNLWFGTLGGGVSRYDGVNWVTYTTADGLAENEVLSIAEDSSGALWFGTQGGGVSRHDGVSWRTYTTADGLRSANVHAILQDRSGAMWFGFGNHSVGVSRFDGTNWTTYTTADGLVNNCVEAIFQDREGIIWFATWGGVSRYDGTNWESFTVADGLGKGMVLWIAEDHLGDLWFATQGGVSRYDGENWGTVTTADGLPHIFVYGVLEDDSGDLWSVTAGGLSQHRPDRVRPQTVISPRPPSLSTSTTQTIAFAAAYRDLRGTAFSYSFDGSPWSDWSPIDFVQVGGLADGEHVFEVRARDLVGNVDTTAAVCVFEIDATAPAPQISGYSANAPASEASAVGTVLRGTVEVTGTAADPRFEKYRLEVRAAGVSAWDSLAESWTSVTDGSLATWSTLATPDGDYEVRLSETDSLGLTGVAIDWAVVDNCAPWADETSPARVSAAAGGDVYTTGGQVHLYFPPRAFPDDANVIIDVLSNEDVPDTLDGGARRAMAGYRIGWGGSALQKAATMSLSVTDSLLDGDLGTLAVYLKVGVDWLRLGGTVDVAAGTISLPVDIPAEYAVFLEDDVPEAGGGVQALAVTPRVFSPAGGFADDEVGIGFSLGRSGPVTVKVYNRAGRLVREVASGLQMNVGANLIRWDGRDADGKMIEDGLYLVTVEGLGDTRVKTLAVVR
jgi:ligand-binding sensor domain-containing protein